MSSTAAEKATKEPFSRSTESAGRGLSRREGVLVAVLFAAFTAFYTFPWAFHLGSLAYGTDGADGQFSVWNVAWVARALVLDPRHVFDANIFYPERGTLAYSEANLGSGALAVPLYWSTGSPFIAHGFVVLLSFVLSGWFTYALIRFLDGAPLGALVGGIGFAYAPHLFAHLHHIQLLWTAGLPAGLLAFHRLAERPTTSRAIILGVAVSAQVYLCAYYGVFLVLILGAFTVWAVVRGGSARGWPLWRGLAVGALVSVALSLPLLGEVARFQRTTGFTRALEASTLFSANWPAYFASAAHAHRWLLEYLPRWNEVLFPGFVTLSLATVGVVASLRPRSPWRDTVLMYAALAVLAVWASLGPDAGLYRWLYAWLPPLWLMRAPSRFGVAVLLACAVLGGLGLSHVLTRVRRPWLAGACVLALAVAEHVVPLQFAAAWRPDPVYRTLATLPPGPLLETPVYSRGVAFLRARYMLASTYHWMPLVNGFSDYVPPSLDARLDVLGGFPSADSLRELTQDKVRYVIVHVEAYNAHQMQALEARLREFEPHLRPRHVDERARLYELTGVP